MRFHRFSIIVAFAALATAAAVVAGPSTPAQARPIEENFSITLASQRFGDALYTPRNSVIVVDQSNQFEQQTMTISVRQDGVKQLTFRFSSRDSSERYFEVDYYDHAQRQLFTDPGRPGISVGPLGFCDVESGNFEVRDIDWDGPAITKMWITYQRYCDGADPAFGELRLGYPESSFDVSPQVVRWPRGTYPGRVSPYDVPITVRSTSSLPNDITSVSVVGPHANDFPIRENACSGPLTATGCVARVGFTPHAPGPRHAKLRVSTTLGDTYVSLDGFGALGRSEWVLDIDYEDPSTPNEHLELPFSASRGGPYEFGSQAWGDDRVLWKARFDLAGNETFAEGRHYAYHADGTGLRMSLSRGTGACEIDRADVDVFDLGFSGPDDNLALLDLAMDVHCRASYGHTVQGRLKFHDRDDQTVPGAVTDLRAARQLDGSVKLDWTNPASVDFAGVMVRWYPGRIAPRATDGGTAVHVGTANTAQFAASTESPVAVSVWAYDDAGNVGAHAWVVLEPSETGLPALLP